MSKIVVTGGAGFIGSHIVDAMIEMGHEVTVIDNFSTGRSENLNPKVRLMVNDVTSDVMHDAFEGGDYVYHLAAQVNLRRSIKFPVVDCYTNVSGTVSMLEHAAKAGVKKFIYFSTGGALYAPTYESMPWKETDRIMPLSPYGTSKWCGEKYTELYSRTRGLDYVIFRPSNVYGPRQDAQGEAGVVAIFKEKIEQNKDVEIFGNGKQSRDFVHVDDVVRAAVLAMEPNIRGAYNISTGVRNSIMGLAFKMFDNSPIDGRSRKPSIRKSAPIDGEMYASCLDNQKLLDVGWPKPMDLDTGLKRI